jgi:hypothetical protein
MKIPIQCSPVNRRHIFEPKLWRSIPENKDVPWEVARGAVKNPNSPQVFLDSTIVGGQLGLLTALSAFE